MPSFLNYCNRFLGAVGVCFLFSVTTQAQKVGGIYLPPQTIDMPSWAVMLYEENINVFKIDSALARHKRDEEVSGNKVPFTGEILTGEENKNIYELYYKRWRRYVNRFVQPDGSIIYPSVPQQSNPDVFEPGVVSANRNSGVGVWTLVGPVETFYPSYQNAAQPPANYQSNTYAIAMAPTNHNVLYNAPESGGLFKTSDKGLNWSLILDEPNVGSSVVTTYSGDAFTAIAIDPTNENVVYAMRNNTIRKTLNGGATWNTVNMAFGTPNAIAIKPSDPNVLYVAASNGLYRSVNGGAAWALVTGTNGNVTDVFLKTNADTVVYILRQSGGYTQPYRSVDNGVTFTLSNTGWTGKGYTADGGGRMTVTPADPERLYAIVLGNTVSKPYIFRSNDGGVTWDTTCTGIIGSGGGSTVLPLGMSNGQGYYDLDIIANPLNADQLIVATNTAYRSVNGGGTFTQLGGYGGPFSIHPDIQEMIALGGDTWIATDGGVTYSSDFYAATANFSIRNKGIFASDFWGFTQAWNDDIVAGGRYHNGNTVMYENYPAGKALRMGGGEAPTGYTLLGRERSVVFSDLDPGVVIPQTFNGAKSSFGFAKFPNETGWTYGFGFDASELEFHPYCYNIIYVGEGNTLWRSDNGGVSFTSVYLFGGNIKQFEIARSNPNVIYVTAGSGLYKSVNAGASFSLLATPSGISFTRMELSVDFQDENILWICSSSNPVGKRVYKSVNGGAAWINLTTPFIDGQAYENILTQAGTNGGVYITGKGGKVYYRNNTMSDWVDFSTGLPRGTFPLRTLPFYRDGKLRLAGSRGIWEIDMYEPSVPVAQPTVDKIVTYCARDTFYFDDFSAFKHAGGTWTWSFPGASYVSSTAVRNPKVVYSTAGNYQVTLTVANAAGNSTKTISNMVQILANECLPDTIPGTALNLQSPGDYAQQQRPMQITTNTLTLSCWIKPNGIQPSFAGIVFSGSGGASGLNFRNANQLGYHWQGTSGSYNWAGGPTVNPNEWSHVALVVTPSNATIYLNGVAYTRTAAHNAVTFSSVFQLGIDRSNTTRNYVGLMDEVAIYNRALSQNEIRELMNLTRNNPNAGSMPATDPALKAYYQFNEGNGKPAYDRSGLFHSDLAGAAVKGTPSTAPVGGGIAQRMNITASGNVNFTVPSVEITVPAGTTPNGEVVVTRLHVPSDQPCAATVFPNTPASYYVIRNYGTNAVFSPLTRFKIYNVKTTNAAMAASPGSFGMYSRAANADGATWGTVVDVADAVTDIGGTGSVEFTTGLNLTTFGQFSFGYSSSPLPIELLFFDAELNRQDQVDVTWISAAEIHFDRYEVEHSVTGSDFKKIGVVQGKGPGQYHLLHATPVNGINYYRLKMIDLDGSFEYSQIKGVRLMAGKADCMVSPNPTGDGWVQLHFTHASQYNAAVLSVINDLGQTIKTVYLNDFSNTVSVHLGTSGMYELRVVFQDGTVLSRRVVVR